MRAIIKMALLPVIAVLWVLWILEENGGRVTYDSIKSRHSFIGRRMKLTRIVGEWTEKAVTL